MRRDCEQDEKIQCLNNLFCYIFFNPHRFLFGNKMLYVYNFFKTNLMLIKLLCKYKIGKHGC